MRKILTINSPRKKGKIDGNLWFVTIKIFKENKKIKIVFDKELLTMCCAIYFTKRSIGAHVSIELLNVQFKISKKRRKMNVFAPYLQQPNAKNLICFGACMSE